MAFVPPTASPVYLQYTNPLPMPCMLSANSSGSQERVEAGKEKKMWNKDEVLFDWYLCKEEIKKILKTH